MRLVARPLARQAARHSRLVLVLSVAALLQAMLPGASGGVAGRPLLPIGQGIAQANTPNPSSVTIAGDLQSELGCPGDWQPDCAATHLTYDANDDVWQGSFAVPAGNWQYKAALNDGWDENYGAGGVAGGANIELNLGAPGAVKFYYDHKSHWVTDSVTSTIAVAPGSFQSELGCAGDWDPGCLRSWLQDPDGDGVYEFETTALPAGSYETKVALDETWAVNYGQGGVQDGPNIPFSVPVAGAKVTFRYDAGTHVLTVLAGHANDNNVEWDGLRHDSRDLLYRTPGGAVAAGTPVTIRFRTFHDDVSSVKLRLYDINQAGQRILTMSRAAASVSCYQPSLAAETCDYWSVTPHDATPDNYWYRFVVTDGTDTDYYGDDTWALDGGLGAPSDDPIDRSFALMVFDPAFSAPSWASHAVIYQIFPDRFRNGRKDNDAKTGDLRYDDPVLALPWGTKPEGYCRNYEDADTTCLWRYDHAGQSGTKESPRGRDYFGGDLKGVDQELGYLQSLGVTAIYFNPIFDAGSNHSYDTQDYTKIDPYFGTQKDWDNLQKHATQLGIRIILDGVFNHMSSDSPFFDRYGHSGTVGACESATSAYRGWFTFHDVAAGTGTCVGSDGTPKGATYDGWFGFDSIPVLTKSLPAIQQYFITNPDSVARRWLQAGASAWRLDVMGDSSFPTGYWEQFRSVVKGAKPDALIIGELWQKDSTLLRFLRGDRADTTMDYRFRDAVVGLLAPQSFDSKGFADSGSPITPSQFAARLQSIREDYADPTYYSLMNLLDSHDTERLLWTLTPGPETTAGREQNASNLGAGKGRLRLASLVQFTVPGAPTVYYGDEVGVTGDDDPDDRRTYPWADLGGHPDLALFSHYQTLAALRQDLPVLTDGDLRVLLADDGAETVAYGRRTGSQAAVVALNRGSTAQTLHVPVAGYVPDGISFSERYGVGFVAGGAAHVVSGGALDLSLPALSGIVLATDTVDLTPPAAPADLQVAEGANQLSLNWDAVPDAAGYDVYYSPLSGGGYVKANGGPVLGTSFTITGLENARTYYLIVRALDAAGNASQPSGESSGVPHLTIGWANLQWPPSIVHTISAVTRTPNVYGQIWIDGVTNLPGPAPSVRAQLGSGPDGSDPATAAGWDWLDAAFNTDAGNNDEYVASLLPDAVGTFDYAYRYSVDGGRTWVYADLDGIGNGYSPAQAGDLQVVASGDTTAPATPVGLHVMASSPAAIDLAWDPIAGDPTLFGYEVQRADSAAGPFSSIGSVGAPDASFTDASVSEGATYYYAVRAVDTSFNRSSNSDIVSATAEPRTVTVVFTVTVPAPVDGAVGKTVYIAGTLSRLNGGLPDWNPGAVALTQVDATHWTITVTGQEATQLEYKYTLGSWDFVEKDGSCGEIGNRQLTLSYGSTGTQSVYDTVLNWRNVTPCGN